MEDNYREIKTKKAWGRILPHYTFSPSFTKDSNISMPEESPKYSMVTQAEFLREYYPSGHKIYDTNYYQDIYRQETVAMTDADGNPELDSAGNPITKTTTYCERVPRYAFAFQQIITCKQLTHLCGNDIQFDCVIKNPSAEQQATLDLFHQGWLEKDMEIAFYEAAKSVKATGDAAMVGYMVNGKFAWKTLSALDGNVLYPHYNHDGSLALFARSFSDYDETGKVVTNWLEVWDNQFLYRYKQGASEDSLMHKIKEIFGLNGYKLVEKSAHNFPFIPVAYKRDEDGACWSASQSSIDCYELTVSQMAHNNQFYGEPIMYIQGENIQAIHDLNGSIRMLNMGPEDKAGYLQSQSASDSYEKQLELLYKMIYEQSFSVIPPKIGGNSDISGAAIKILYSPAVEKAMSDANEYQSFLNDMVKIFRFGYGVEQTKTLDFANLPIKAWIKPYIHTNESGIINDLVQAVSAGFVSKQTASERASFYSQAGEWDRLIRESKEEQQADLLYQMKNNQQTEENNSDNNEE